MMFRVHLIRGLLQRASTTGVSARLALAISGGAMAKLARQSRTETCLNWCYKNKMQPIRQEHAFIPVS